MDQALLERNFDQAIFWAQKATGSPSFGQPLNTQDIFALMLQGYCERWAGQNEEAHGTFERVIQELPLAVFSGPRQFLERELYLALAYAGIGEKANAHEQAWRGVADYDNDALMKPIAETYQARVLAQLGDVDAAILALPHLLEMPGGIRPGKLRFSPYWDPLRKDPRFEALAKESAAGSVLKSRGDGSSMREAAANAAVSKGAPQKMSSFLKGRAGKLGR